MIMVTKNVLKSLIGSGIKVTASGKTDVVVGPKAVVDSDDNYAIYMTGSNQTLTIKGTVRSSGDDAIKFGDSDTDRNHTVIVAKSGFVIGDDDDTLSFASMNPTIINHGTVVGLYPIYCYSEDTTKAKIVNTGSVISTSSDAIYVSGVVGGIVEITNSGKLHSYSDGGISVSDLTLKLVNTGMIIGNYDPAIDASVGNDNVLNSGKIWGDIVLADGNDVYNGSKGALFGLLLGGNGNDRFTGGARAETMFGGEGNDRLTGGAGKDTLSGDNGNDSFIFNALSERGDLIGDFSNTMGNDDRILISAASFGAGLTKGTLAASRFQARADNVAQDGNDRFIYNTTDGTLWFDKDGNGSANAVLLATVPMVMMTAADIVIF